MRTAPVCVVLCCSMAGFSAVGQVVRVGGFSAARAGSISGILQGSAWQSWRNDFSTKFQTATLSETAELTPSFLSSIDLLLISAVAEGSNVQTAPLSSSEQGALLGFIMSGGRAVIVTDNSLGYTGCSDTLLAPFGMTSTGSLSGTQYATTITNPPSCSIVRGLFGSVNTLQGSWPGSLGNTGTATVLSRWDANSTPSLATGTFGGGRVVFMTDPSVLDLPFNSFVESNRGRYNALWWLGVRPRLSPAAATVCSSGTVNLEPAVQIRSNPTYQWYHNQTLIPGATSAMLTLTGATLIPGDYTCIYADSCGTTATAPSTVRVCSADFNCDAVVDFFDYLDFVSAFSTNQSAADFNHDSVIDFFDYLDFVQAFSEGC